MQTFLPYSSYGATARVLDRQRLGKQRVETLQILQALAPDSESKWQRHPAVKMWRGYEFSLILYGVIICREWIKRGYKDTCLEKISSHASLYEPRGPVVLDPPWMDDVAFHRSHRSNLVRKDPDHYRPLFEAGLPSDLEYIWPVS